MTTAAIRAYPFHATEKNVVRIGLLDVSGDGPQSLSYAAFLLPCAAFFYGRTGWGAARLAGADPVDQPIQFRPPRLVSGLVVRSTNWSQHIMTTTDLVPVFTGIIQHQSVQLCNARDLHKFLESRQDFSNWIKNRIEQYGFIADEDYSINLSNRSDGKAGKRRTEYHLTLDMAKELAMVENNEKGRQIRRYFISLERSNKPALPDQTASQDHLMRCVELSSHLASVAQKALINTLLKSGDKTRELARERFMVCFDHEMRPYAKAIDPDAMIVTLEQLASFITQPNGIMASDTELINLAKACMDRLSERVEYQVKKASRESGQNEMVAQSNAG